MKPRGKLEPDAAARVLAQLARAMADAVRIAALATWRFRMMKWEEVSIRRKSRFPKRTEEGGQISHGASAPNADR